MGQNVVEKLKNFADEFVDRLVRDAKDSVTAHQRPLVPQMDPPPDVGDVLYIMAYRLQDARLTDEQWSAHPPEILRHFPKVR